MATMVSITRHAEHNILLSRRLLNIHATFYVTSAGYAVCTVSIINTIIADTLMRHASDVNIDIGRVTTFWYGICRLAYIVTSVDTPNAAHVVGAPLRIRDTFAGHYVCRYYRTALANIELREDWLRRHITRQPHRRR